MKGVTGAVVGLCTFCGTVGGGALYLADYKKKIDLIDDLQLRIAKLELRPIAGGTVAGAIGPEGLKGADGRPGRQGEVGPQGERGLTGPKGEPGVSPTQVADFEKRLVVLEKRPIVAQRSNSLQVTSAGDDQAVTLTRGITRAANGCIVLTPELFIGTATLSQYDKVCSDSAASNYSYVTSITEDRISLTTGTNNWACYKGDTNCGFSWKSDVLFKPVKFMAGNDNSKNRYEIEFRRK